MQGKEELATIGLNLPGFSSLDSQGWMRKPHAIKVGALHDWVELDGVLYSFEKGNNDAEKLANALNSTYRPPAALGQGKDIVVYTNAASSTGFDIQFTARVAGVPDSRRRPLNEESLELLQDPTHCGLLQPRLVIKLTRPTLIFKQKTPDGGERYLDTSPETVVRVSDEEGDIKLIDLSQPVNYLRLGPIELTAVFNHPAINKHGKLAASEPQPQQTQKTPEPSSPPHPAPSAQPVPTPEPAPVSVEVKAAPPRSESSAPLPAQGRPRPAEAPPFPTPPHPKSEPAVATPVSPNLWLKPILAQQPMRYDWFDCLVYAKIAEKFGNSFEGQFHGGTCWSIAAGDVEDISDPEFKGIFLAEKVGFGFLHHGYAARFDKGNVFIGKLDSSLEGTNIGLVFRRQSVQARIARD